MGSPSIPGFPGWAISSVQETPTHRFWPVGVETHRIQGWVAPKKRSISHEFFEGFPMVCGEFLTLTICGEFHFETHHLWWISDTPEVDCSCGSDSAKSWRVRRHWTTALHLRSLGTQEFGTGRRRQLTSCWVHWRAETEQTHTVSFNEREQE
jgi:hypothetical protein